LSNIYESLNNLYKKPLYVVAEEMNYSKSNILILSKKFDLLKMYHPDVWNALLSCKHNSDKRSIEEYALDLVSSWLYEDTILMYLKKNDFNIKLSGSDYQRKILPNSKISSNSDFIIQKDIKEKHVELINSYTNYWSRTQKVDLRDNKYLKLKSEKALLLCIDVYSKQFFIIDLLYDNHDIKYIPFHKPYAKPAYQVSINSYKPINFTILNLVQELNKIFI